RPWFWRNHCQPPPVVGLVWRDHRALLAAPDPDRAALKAIANERLELAAARHHAHRPGRRETASAEREGNRTRHLKILGDAVADRRLQHLFVRLIVARANRPRLIEAPAIATKRRRGCAEERAV